MDAFKLQLGSVSTITSHQSSVSTRSDRTEERYEKPQGDYVIPKILAYGFAAILENTLDSIVILGKMMDLPKVQVDVDYRTLEEKYSECYRDHIFDPETLQSYEVALECQKELKFHRDRTFLEKILKDTCLELITDKCFDKLKRRIEEHDMAIKEENELLAKTGKIELEIESFQKRMEEERATMLQQIQSTTEEIGILKDEFERLHFENDVKLKYVESWEMSRYEANGIKLDWKEDDYTETIREKSNAVDREARIHAEVELFLTEMSQEYEDLILSWMDRYEKEMEQLETDIQILKEKREEQFEQTEQLREEYERRNVAIADYLEVKELRRQEQERQEQRARAAIKIQAWWRGTMVRKCLGPYRKKKKGKGKDKKKK